MRTSTDHRQTGSMFLYACYPLSLLHIAVCDSVCREFYYQLQGDATNTCVPTFEGDKTSPPSFLPFLELDGDTNTALRPLGYVSPV
eukprot:1196290-Prorocentrum_minimum.AAC.5